MKKFFTLVAISAIVTSCSQTSEQSASEADLKLFLDEVEESNLKEGPIVSSAYWIGSNFYKPSILKILLLIMVKDIH